MRWLPSISFSPASSSSISTSPLKSPSDGESPNDSNINNNNNSSSSSVSSSKRSEEVGSGTWRFGPIKRLTRQRKLRHLSDNDVVGVSAGSITLEPLSLTRSPSMASRSTTMSEAKPQPQPLPLPELGIFRAKERPVPDFVNVPLPSPKTAQSRVVEDRDRDRDRASSSVSPIKSVFASRDTKGGMDYGEKRSYRRELPEQNCSESSRDDFRVHVPMRSAPNSPFSSPALSPHRASTGDSFPYYYYMIPKGNQVWSAPEIPTTAMIPGFPPPAFFDYHTLSSDTSPLHSPRAKCPQQFPKSQSSCPVNVHPLPLPPGAATPSPSTTTPNPISPPPTPPPQPIVKLESVPMNSQWKKGKLIGRGTFGSVYVATNRETGALCAMKEVEIFPDDPKSAESIKQLQQEIKVLSQLKHPNIVQYYGSEIVDDRFFIYLEYVHPGSINKYVREHCGAITESVVRNFTRHILFGLAYLHSTKTIHRDIKGANLLVDSSGVVKLADFGMAKHLTGQAADLSLKGSPYWMAPELMQAVMQRDSNSDLALAVDIWSLGCTIIEMLTGKPPWSDFEGAAAMFKVMRDTPPIPETLSSEGKDFLRCCFQRNPAERSSAAMLLEHRFLKNSQQLDVPSCNPAFNGKNLTEKPHSPRERSENKCDQLPRFPSTPIAKEKLASESDTGQQSHHETSDLTVASRYSPRSTLEAHSSLSPPHTGCNRHYPSPSASIPSNVKHGAKKSSNFR
ncbi:mitogen-activated protein kinase kinase kinase 5 isoform X1 [Quercus robur]|uniref:mitogen-activated protein kinase kinase kinase 5 isoform X1 n=1 Tax=Quercus robur TaxID=38942 RepID=UPI0021635230|nr:mitogen-activated protein kinase kinase kinase 5 isoform X1 [Quercus robur]